MDYKRLNVLDKRTPNRGANPFVDDYVGFTWNNIHSSNYNCFIENTGHLDFVGAPDFSNNFISPAFQTRTYYTGTASQSKKFSLNLVFYQLTLPELNAALHWLDRSIISDLYFDYEPYWKYSCKLASIGVIEKYVTGRTMYRGRACDTYLCKLPLTFETVYHPEAISAYTVFKSTEQTTATNMGYLDDSTTSWTGPALPYSQNSGGDFMPFRDLLGDETELDKYRLNEEGNQDTYVDDKGHHVTVAEEAANWSNMILIEPVNMQESGTKYWRLKLRNPSSHSTTFKLHFFNVGKGVDVWQIWNKDYVYGQRDPDDIDAYSNSLNIMHVALDLDDEHLVNLHYNSEDGTVLLGNQLIESVRGTQMPICSYKSAVANVLIPGAINPDQPASIDLEIKIYAPTGQTNNAQFAIEYDTYEYTV